MKHLFTENVRGISCVGKYAFVFSECCCPSFSNQRDTPAGEESSLAFNQLEPPVYGLQIKYEDPLGEPNKLLCIYICICMLVGQEGIGEGVTPRNFGWVCAT